MCDPATAGLIISAGSGALGAVNNADALRRADNEAARGIRRQGEIQAKSNRRVNEQVEDIASNTGRAEREEALGGFLNALRADESSTRGALDSVPGASDRFAEEVGEGRTALRTRGDEKAQRLSVIDGILRQRLNEGNATSRTQSDLQGLGADSNAAAFLAQLRASEQRPNTFVDVLSGVGQGVGAGLALRPPKAAADPIIAALRKGTLIDNPVGTPPAGVFA